MKKRSATICFNVRARQADRAKLTELQEALRRQGISYDVLDALRLPKASAESLGDLLVAVGGDGTANLVAAAALEHGRKLAIIPQGTFNHFAKDLGLPLDMGEAAQTAATGIKRLVDAGRVNGRIFLNNSVIGFYPQLVAKRESLQSRFGKWIALAIAAGFLLPKMRRYQLQLLVNGKTISVRTSLLVVANNRYDLGGLGLASRKRLDEGKLHIYALKAKNVPGAVGASLRLLAGRAKTGDFDHYRAERLEISSKKATVRIALDGEAVRLDTPLYYEISPKSLSVMT